ncbi:hypothetical protein B0H13DRAFT_2387526 [Mycena leptocephala]|nr:hypothetical protein B0H13DRAFT_2387526 [Mycena leptocephala]
MFDFADFEEGMYVWLRESKLDETKGDKEKWTYSGPYIIHQKRDRDSFVLRELSGAVLKGHVNIRRLRLFYYRPEHQTLRTSLNSPPKPTVSANPQYRLDYAMQALREEIPPRNRVATNITKRGFHEPTDRLLGFPLDMCFDSISDHDDRLDPRKNASYVRHDLALKYYYEATVYHQVEASACGDR